MTRFSYEQFYANIDTFCSSCFIFRYIFWKYWIEVRVELLTAEQLYLEPFLAGTGWDTGLNMWREDRWSNPGSDGGKPGSAQPSLVTPRGNARPEAQVEYTSLVSIIWYQLEMCDATRRDRERRCKDGSWMDGSRASFKEFSRERWIGRKKDIQIDRQIHTCSYAFR